MGRHLLAAGEDVGEVAGCIFLHPRSEQTLDQSHWVCQEAMNKYKRNSSVFDLLIT